MTKETKNNDGDLGQIEPPRYVCHKKVWALKIHSVTYPAIPAGVVILKFFDVMFLDREMPPAFLAKHDPRPGGYLVRYEDGYESFSPEKAFTEGYALMEGSRPEHVSPEPASHPYEYRKKPWPGRTQIEYRKKPIVIEAFQLTPFATWPGWAKAGDIMTRTKSGSAEISSVKIKTLEGTMTAVPGDWIIRGVQGELYSCKDEIFQASYDKFVR